MIPPTVSGLSHRGHYYSAASLCLGGEFKPPFRVTTKSHVSTEASAAERRNDRHRHSLSLSGFWDDCHIKALGLGRIDHHCETFDAGGPADRWRVRPTEGFDQPVVAAAANDSALRAEPVGDEFERRVAIIVEPAYQ